MIVIRYLPFNLHPDFCFEEKPRVFLGKPRKILGFHPEKRLGNTINKKNQVLKLGFFQGGNLEKISGAILKVTFRVQIESLSEFLHFSYQSNN